MMQGALVSPWQLPLPGGRSVEYDGGILRIQLESTDGLPPMPASDAKPLGETLGSIEIRDTGTKKGYGAYCMEKLPRHTFLGFYRGKRIVVAPTADAAPPRGDYVLGLDGGVTFLDGYEAAQDRSNFTPAHLNHQDKGEDGCNCLRIAKDERVAFFTSREVLAGEELCFDYGSNYWRGRKDEKI